MWLASYLFDASGTGPRSRAERDYLLWEVALAELLQYRHCAFLSAGCWTLIPGPPASETASRLSDWQPVDFQG